MIAARSLTRTRSALAQRVAADLEDGWVANIGIGIPSSIPALVPPEVEVMFHCEHGLLGVGRPAEASEVDPDITDAAKAHVTLVEGASAFDSSLSFAIARGGRLDVTVLGALQVSGHGDLANWVVPGGDPGVGGAMDLAVGARRCWVTMMLADKTGAAKLLPACTFPLTGQRVVDRLYSDLGVFEFVDDATVLRELPDGVRVDDVAAATPVRFEVDLW